MQEVQIKKWTVLELVKSAEEVFRKNNIDSPRLNADLLLASATGSTRFQLYLDFDKPLQEKEIIRFREMVKRRLNHEPLQYIIGKTEFFGMEFLVNQSVLIPRQETEHLVEESIRIISGMNFKPKILEIGTGSGCISVSIAAKSVCEIDAIDISEEAIISAQKNSDTNNTSDKIKFEQKDFIFSFENFDNYIIVISNPPYIPIDEYKSLAPELKDYEPKFAFTDDGDGLKFYQKIFECYLNTNDKPILILEIGDGKKNIIEELLKKYSITNYNFSKDLIGIDRMLTVNS